MENKVIQKFYVVGISTRTTNKDGQSSKDIETLWGKFWDEKIQNQIPNKINDNIYAIYTDYETDFNGAYTTIIGASVKSLENIPNGFVGITIEKGNYKNFVSKGKMPDAVVKTWMEIWADNKLNKQRLYNVDFTIHDEKYYDGDNAEVETFISITK
jgi:predicted transcriptional regulator YdeE